MGLALAPAAAAQPGPTCPLFWPAGEALRHAPHDEPPSLDVARRWLELGRPRVALDTVTAIAKPSAERDLYRLGALFGLGQWSSYVEAAETFEREYAMPACRPLIERWRGHARSALGDGVAADRAFDALERALPALGAYVALWRLEAAAQNGDLARGRAAWATIVAAGLPDAAERRAQQALAALYDRTSDHRRSREWHLELAEGSRGLERGRHRLAAAAAADRGGDIATGDRLRRLVLRETPALAAPIVLDADLRRRLGLSALEAARVLLAARLSAPAIRAATEALVEADGARAGEALRLRAEAHALAGDRAAAEADYAAFLSRWPLDAAVPEVLFARARLALSHDDGDTARRRFQNFLARFADHRRAPAARYLIADSYQDDRGDGAGHADLAIAGFDQLVREHPRDFYADRAYLRAAHLTYALGRYREAADRYAAYPGSQSRREARYWLARTQQRLGAAGTAREILQALATTGGDDYYALLSRDRLAGTEWFARNGTSTGSVALSGPAAPVPPDPVWDRAAALLALGERRLARAELARGLTRERGDRAALRRWATALVAWGFPDLAVRVGVWLGERDAGAGFAFPVGFRSAVVGEARAHELEPSTLLALIRQESVFDPDAESPVGARGLMQIMPATGREIADSLAWRDYDEEMLLDPSVSLHFGARYLAQQGRHFDGFWPAVLAAYNAGPHNVERWVLFPEREVDAELWIDRIPFRETRDYVKRVVAHYARYSEAIDGRDDR